MSDSAPLDRTLAALTRASLHDVLVLGLRHPSDAPVPHYRPYLLGGFWLALGEGLVWFEHDQGVLRAVPTPALHLPEHLESEDREDLCVLGGDGFTLDRGRTPVTIGALELVAENDDALREAAVLAVFVQCTDGTDLFVHAWSFEGVHFGRAHEYAAWRAELATPGGWRRYRWDAANLPWTWSSGRNLAP